MTPKMRLATEAIALAWGLACDNVLETFSKEISQIRNLAHTLAKQRGTTFKSEALLVATLKAALNTTFKKRPRDPANQDIWRKVALAALNMDEKE